MAVHLVSQQRPWYAPSGGGRISGVDPRSAAGRAGLRDGDVLVAINGRLLHDVLDYQFYASDERLVLLVQRDGQDVTVDLDGGVPLGLQFEESTFDGIRRCRNRCPFCFVKQLPKGLRRSLYVKDDDYRYSVAYGGFVTLTNMAEEDWERLAEQRLGPLRISVHATDLALRRRLLGNPRAPDVLQQLRRLGGLGLTAHAQLVLCPGVNDGAQLARSVADLAALYPTVQSIAVVPVGFTRQVGQHGLRSYTGDKAAAVVEQVTIWQRQYRQRFGTSLVYLADEFYFLAGRKFPPGYKYDGYPQYENGIGLVRSLLDEWARLRRRGVSGMKTVRLTLVCGQRIAPVLTDIAAWLSANTPLASEVVAVENTFFGPAVNVSGLLTGRDVSNTLGGRVLGDVVVLPGAMLDPLGERFLDDGTPVGLQVALDRPVVFARTLRELLRCVSMA